MTPPGRLAAAQAGLAALCAYASARSLIGGSAPWAAVFLAGYLIALRAMLRFHALSVLYRAHARELERRARPPDPAAADDDTISIALNDACCEPWWTSAGTAHATTCPRKEQHR